MICINKKNGKKYIHIKEIEDATNSREGNILVIYKDVETGKEYARDKKEFFEKFEELQINKKEE